MSSKFLQPFTEREEARYSRHFLLPDFGLDEQRRLKRSRVLIVGVGGLGCPAAIYLAASGIGQITLVDHDRVEISNLHRQILFEEEDVGHSKAQAARARLQRSNPHTDVVSIESSFQEVGTMGLVEEHDVVIDGTDNFPARYLIHDTCAFARRPYVYGSIFQFHGQVSVFQAFSGPCYRCLFPFPPVPQEAPSCAEAGVLGMVPGIVGTLQALEAVKLISGVGDSLLGSLLLFDARVASFRTVRLERDRVCPLCGENPVIDAPRQEHASCLGEDNGVDEITEISCSELLRELSHDKLSLIDVRTPAEYAGGSIAGARNVPLSEIEVLCEEVEFLESLVVFCQSGQRSREAARRLRARGFTRVRNLRGGLEFCKFAENER